MPRASRNVLAACVLVGRELRQTAGDLSVVAIGDWGGHSDQEPTTYSQRVTGIGLSRVALDINANFTIMMGDNIYQHGIHGDDMSSRFRDTFEAVYAKSLPGGHFYALAGNHDYGQGVLANVSAQVAYTKRSKQWRFPSLWYNIHRAFEVDGKARSLDMIVIDTVVLCGNGPENEEFINEQLRFLGDEHLLFEGQTRRQAAAKAQFAWLEHELSSSKADFLWVVGHYPIWSAGTDGSSKCLIDRLRPMLQAHAAHYISGHDHMLEHFEHEGLNTFVVGAGMECCYQPVNIGQIPSGAMQYMLAGENGTASWPSPPPFPVLGGFATLRFGVESVAISLHAHNGTVLYAPARIPRRQRVAERISEPDVLLGLQAAPFVTSAFMLIFSLVLLLLLCRKRRTIGCHAIADVDARTFTHPPVSARAVNM
eukprot:TRINITY_DN6015_c0_g1_i6.p1 TRINITY_DN6015_c0_g1~~TRINITY_DN6015_c0_g1_i6.p1  ORF type:complete len:424 (-),score=52.90 TRINITY_DN6015_c0_g1_i6:129-1400(-)